MEDARLRISDGTILEIEDVIKPSGDYHKLLWDLVYTERANIRKAKDSEKLLNDTSLMRRYREMEFIRVMRLINDPKSTIQNIIILFGI